VTTDLASKLLRLLTFRLRRFHSACLARPARHDSNSLLTCLLPMFCA
jgi:hypothetical protein